MGKDKGTKATRIGPYNRLVRKHLKALRKAEEVTRTEDLAFALAKAVRSEFNDVDFDDDDDYTDVLITLTARYGHGGEVIDRKLEAVGSWGIEGNQAAKIVEVAKERGYTVMFTGDPNGNKDEAVRVKFKAHRAKDADDKLMPEATRLAEEEAARLAEDAAKMAAPTKEDEEA